MRGQAVRRLRGHCGAALVDGQLSMNRREMRRSRIPKRLADQQAQLFAQRQQFSE